MALENRDGPRTPATRLFHSQRQIAATMTGILTLVAGMTCLGSEPAAPIALHPGNPHYCTWKGKPTLLVTSGEHYGAVLNLDFDYVPYLEELQSRGLNLTRTFSGIYREIPASFGITDNPLAPKPNRYICPWARGNEPGYFDGGNKFDLTRWDPAYFQRLRDFVSTARRCGVVVELPIFCPFYNDALWRADPMHAANNINGIGECPREEVYALKHDDLTKIQIAVTRKIVRELRDYDNLYFEVCNEPYFGGVTMPWQHKMVDTIVAAERDLPARHLISLNIANGRKKVEKPHPAVSIFNFHYCTPPDTVDLNYRLNKAIGENETGFRGSHDVLYRTEGWMFLLAGGALYNNLDYSFTPGHPDGTLSNYTSPGGGSATLRDQLRILKTFLEDLDFVNLRPDSESLVRVKPNLANRMLSQPGKTYAIYLQTPLGKKPKNLDSILKQRQTAKLTIKVPRGKYLVEWVDTKNGQVDRSETTLHPGGEWQLTSPPFVVDIAVRIRRRG